MRHLKNIDIRVCRHKKGWVVETKKRWFIFSWWVHIISVAGMDDRAWFFSDKESAISETCKYLEWDLLISIQNQGYLNEK